MTNKSSPVWSAGLQAENLPQLFLEKAPVLSRNFAQCDDGRSISYDAFWKMAGRQAQVLLAHGAKPGDRIAVQVDKSLEALALFWACARAGLIFLPLNPAYTAAEVSYFLNDAEPMIFVTTPARQNEMHAVARQATCHVVLTLDDEGGGSLMDAPSAGEFVDAASRWNDIAAILYTSGTTGRSKGAMLSHGNLASNALALADIWQFNVQDRLLHALPVYHTHGLFTATNTVLFSGGQLLLRRRFSADDVMAQLPQATAMMGVPTFYTRLLQHEGLAHKTTRHIRVFISGSAPLLAETHRAFKARTGHAILERYGMTETSMITSNPFEGARLAGTVGFPLPSVEVTIKDSATGQPLEPGQDGMIEVRGPNVFQGYWRNPEKTAEDMRSDGYFITGDVGHVDEKGYLVISGRAKDLVITGGFNVYPKEIEALIDAMAGVKESAVVGLPHADFGEAVTAVVVSEPDTLCDEATMISILKIELAGFKVPKRIIFVDELPRNAMGKVQKAELRKIYAELFRN